ncbi:MAG: ABC transporter ATP-binding protein [Ruminococcaceae bacterium]|nr:ABC transporter ATP-binding protein [Oscillospiraceae bacterium]
MSIMKKATKLNIKIEDVLKREEHFIYSFNKYGDKKIKLFFHLFKGYYWYLFLSAFLFFLKSLPTWILPIITANIITLIQKQPSNFLYQIIINIIVGVVIVLQHPITNTGHSINLNKARHNVEVGVRGAMIRKLQQLSIAYHKEVPAGTLHSKVMRDVEKFESLTLHVFTSVLNIGLGLIITLAIVINKNIYVFLMFLITIPICMLINKVFKTSIKNGAIEYRHSVEKTSSEIVNMLEYMPVSRAHALEQKEIYKLTDTSINQAQKAHNYDITVSYLGSISWSALTAIQLLCLGFTSFLAYKGQITDIGDIALYQSYFSSLLGYANGILGLLPAITSGFDAISSMSEVLSSKDVENTENKTRVEKLEGEYEFLNVSFRYDENSPALKNFNLKVKKGETIAFVGESGSGKSTVINLAVGFYKANEGRVLVDDKDINDINLHSYRRFISVVPQKTILFSGSVRDNITYGSDHISDEELSNVIKAAQLESVIERLPDGVDTEIGEHGDKLSGGQRQRISIARAIIRNPQVIIFDEATSALDSASEREIQKAIDYLTRDRTTFIVAHRLSTIRNADRIVVINKGECVECGSYDELMAKKGAFYKLQALQ